MYKKQQTLMQPVTYSGLGLHSGETCEVHILPAEQNTGIKFHLMNDWECVQEFSASINYVLAGDFRTELGTSIAKVSTVEHLLAALSGLGVDNCIVKVWGPEIPIADGSAKLWCNLINEAGIKPQLSDKTYIKIIKPILVRDGDVWCALAPSDSDAFNVSYTIDYTHPLIGHKNKAIEVTNSTFENEISINRTFGFLKDLEFYKSLGLAKGANYDNTLVFDDKFIANPDKHMRSINEPLMHKILDVIGDLSLASYPILGKFVGHKSGHTLNQQLVKELLNTQKSWKFYKVENNVKQEMLV